MGFRASHSDLAHANGDRDRSRVLLQFLAAQVKGSKLDIFTVLVVPNVVYTLFLAVLVSL